MNWGDCLLHIPRQLAEDTGLDSSEQPSKSEPREPGPTAWDQLHGLNGQAIPGVQALEPPMLASAPIDRHASTRMLSATEIAVFGESRAAGRPGKFRHHVLRDAPQSVWDVASAQRGPHVSRRIIGGI